MISPTQHTFDFRRFAMQSRNQIQYPYTVFFHSDSHHLLKDLYQISITIQIQSFSYMLICLACHDMAFSFYLPFATLIQPPILPEGWFVLTRNNILVSFKLFCLKCSFCVLMLNPFQFSVWFNFFLQCFLMAVKDSILVRVSMIRRLAYQTMVPL